jgi:hypothetical protein
MIFLIVIGGVIVVALGMAALYDRRVRRRDGPGHVGVSPGEPLQARVEVDRLDIEGK